MNDDLIGEEVERMLKEVTIDCNALEKIVIKREIMLMVNYKNIMNQGYPARIHRLVHEIFHRYYSLMEGLEKK